MKKEKPDKRARKTNREQSLHKKKKKKKKNHKRIMIKISRFH